MAGDGGAGALQAADWAIGKLLGRGTSASVFAARNRKTKKPAVVKKLDRLNKAAERAILDEVELMRRTCQHPNIVHFHGWYRDAPASKGAEGVLCLVLGRCHGGDLDSHLRKCAEAAAVLGERQKMLWMVQLLFALTYLHGRHVLHRDIKPANILLSRSLKIVRLADLGVAKHLGDDALAHTVVGTPYYMAPETVSGRPYTFAADVWSLGCVAYELATVGKRAFDARSLPQLVVRVVRNNYAPLPSHVSRPYARLVDSMLRSAPEERPSAADLMAQRYVLAFAEELAGGELGPSDSLSDRGTCGSLTSRTRGSQKPDIPSSLSDKSLKYATTMSSTIKSKARRKKRRSEAVQLAEQMRRRELESALKCRDSRAEARAKAWEYEMRTSRRAVRERREEQELVKTRAAEAEKLQVQVQNEQGEPASGELAVEDADDAAGAAPDPPPPALKEAADAEEAAARRALPAGMSRDDASLGHLPEAPLQIPARLTVTLPAGNASLLEMEEAFAQLSRSDLFPCRALNLTASPGRATAVHNASRSAWGAVGEDSPPSLADAQLPAPAYAGRSHDDVIPLGADETVDARDELTAQTTETEPMAGTVSALDDTRLEALLSNIWHTDPSARWAMLERIWLSSLEEQRDRLPLSISLESLGLGDAPTDTIADPAAAAAPKSEAECMGRAMRRHLAHSPQVSRGSSLDPKGARAMKEAAAELRRAGIDLPTSNAPPVRLDIAASLAEADLAAANDGERGAMSDGSSSDAIEVSSEELFFSSDSDWEESDWVSED